MGTLNVKPISSQQELNEVTRDLLGDIRALEDMLAMGWFNEDPLHIGAEQEFCLVDPAMKASPKGFHLLDQLQQTEHDFTTEIAKFNVECNLPPIPFTGNCFHELHQKLDAVMSDMLAVCKNANVNPVLTGILPTLRKFDLEESNMTPLPRYLSLIKGIKKMKGKGGDLRINGTDELYLRNTSAMLESCNTSFQVHLQIKPEEFVRRYNIAMSLSGPLLAISANSPLLFGKRLWNETRIALFQQTVDTRAAGEHLRDRTPRVTFGNNWLQHSIAEIYKEDIVRFRPFIRNTSTENSLACLNAGTTPALKALAMHNSTIYRWNRACYGLSPNGKPHLRIENRLLPAGPTVIDEVANSVFWLGLMEGLFHEYNDITQLLSFNAVQHNFNTAAHNGHASTLQWMNHSKVSARELIEQELIPLAREGLQSRSIDQADIDRYLDVIAERNKTGKTGACWLLDSLGNLNNDVATKDQLTTLTASLLKNQETGLPVHLWPLATSADQPNGSPETLIVEEFMTRDVFSVSQNDIPELAANIMDWQKIRFLPVEDEKGRLVGLLTAERLVKLLVSDQEKSVCVGDIMDNDPPVISPDKSIMDAMKLMVKHHIRCLPVVKKNKLVGIISEGNFIQVTNSLLKILQDQKVNEGN